MTQPVDWPGLGDEELLIAVANTAHGETDEFADPGSVRAWWRSVGAPVPTRRARSATEHGVTMLRELRSLIRGLALRNNEVEPDPIRFSALDTLTLRLDLRGAPSLHPDVGGDLAHDLSAAAVAALLRAMAKPGWHRFKACRGNDCRWVFIDGSRNTSRRWCDMANCGNRAKLATFRARRRPTARKWVDSSTTANEGT
jgi:predicted RNA-binding Zn ribbon-like protein